MSNDLISRQAAIDAIHCNIVVTGRENAELVAKTIGEFADRIKALPTIQPVATDTNVGDTISKTETVERLRGVIEITVPITDHDGGYIDGIETAISTVSTMPPAQPERMCYGCRYERHGSVVCDSCSRFFLDRYEVDNNG